MMLGWCCDSSFLWGGGVFSLLGNVLGSMTARASAMSGIRSILTWTTRVGCYSSTSASGSTPRQGITNLLEKHNAGAGHSRTSVTAMRTECPHRHSRLNALPLAVNTPPLSLHLLGTFTVPITRRWRFSIIESSLLIIIYHRGRGSGGGLSRHHR